MCSFWVMQSHLEDGGLADERAQVQQLLAAARGVLLIMSFMSLSCPFWPSSCVEHQTLEGISRLSLVSRHEMQEMPHRVQGKGRQGLD